MRTIEVVVGENSNCGAKTKPLAHEREPAGKEDDDKTWRKKTSIRKDPARTYL